MFPCCCLWRSLYFLNTFQNKTGAASAQARPAWCVCVEREEEGRDRCLSPGWGQSLGVERASLLPLQGLLSP